MEIMVYVIECYNTVENCIEQCGMSLSKEIATEQMKLIESKLNNVGGYKVYTDYRVSEYGISNEFYTEFQLYDEED